MAIDAEGFKGFDEKFQRWMDELYVLEQQFGERLDRVEKQFEQRSEVFTAQEKLIQSLITAQQDSLRTLDQRFREVRDWYHQVVTTGLVFLAAIFIGLMVLVLFWWHVHAVWLDDAAFKESLIAQSAMVPDLITQESKLYVRIVPDANVPVLKDSKGQVLQGDYAQVYSLKKLVESSANPS